MVCTLSKRNQCTRLVSSKSTMTKSSLARANSLRLPRGKSLSLDVQQKWQPKQQQSHNVK